jgi:hypothetical protein
MESINVVVEDIPSHNQKKLVTLGDNNEAIQANEMRISDDINIEVEANFDNEQKDIQQKVPLSRIKKNHPFGLIIGILDESRKTRERMKVDYKEMVKYTFYISTLEPKNVKEFLKNEY